MRQITTRQITTCLASAAIALAASAAPALAQDDIGSNPITELFDSFGLGTKEKPDIEYRERAPLVPPSSTAALPAPQAKTSARDAQWPTDPDVVAREERKRQNDKVMTETYSYQMDRSPRVDPDELGNRRVRGASVARTGTDATQGDNKIIRAEPDELAGRSIRDPQAEAGASSAVTRGRLTDPPTGYMQGTGVTAQAPTEEKGFFGKLFGK
jgi:hypothetical protein